MRLSLSLSLSVRLFCVSHGWWRQALLEFDGCLFLLLFLLLLLLLLVLVLVLVLVVVAPSPLLPVEELLLCLTALPVLLSPVPTHLQHDGQDGDRSDDHHRRHAHHQGDNHSDFCAVLVPAVAVAVVALAAAAAARRRVQRRRCSVRAHSAPAHNLNPENCRLTVRAGNVVGYTQ